MERMGTRWVLDETQWDNPRPEQTPAGPAPLSATLDATPAPEAVPQTDILPPSPEPARTRPIPAESSDKPADPGAARGIRLAHWDNVEFT
jgi:hypothetical protein